MRDQAVHEPLPKGFPLNNGRFPKNYGWFLHVDLAEDRVLYYKPSGHDLALSIDGISQDCLGVGKKTTHWDGWDGDTPWCPQTWDGGATFLQWQVPERLVEKKRKWDDALVGVASHLEYLGTPGKPWKHPGNLYILGEGIATGNNWYLIAWQRNVAVGGCGEALHLPTSHCRLRNA